ncbi:hypothetical protein WJX77_001431 [Trebouxia sp. C0004]
MSVSFLGHASAGTDLKTLLFDRALQTGDRGYRLEVVTVRKLEFETDGLAFGDKILARWYPNKADADKKGIMIVVTTGKDGAITGGPSSRK